MLTLGHPIDLEKKVGGRKERKEKRGRARAGGAGERKWGKGHRDVPGIWKQEAMS